MREAEKLGSRNGCSGNEKIPDAGTDGQETIIDRPGNVIRLQEDDDLATAGESFLFLN